MSSAFNVCKDEEKWGREETFCVASMSSEFNVCKDEEKWGREETSRSHKMHENSVKLRLCTRPWHMVVIKWAFFLAGILCLRSI